jgi:NAD(P)-dependent dehydrogenase (short-subunit alcohol dehydrogenase family)
MKDFGGKLAVITGGGTGMGRALARQLVAEGCDVAMCDVIDENLAETRRLCEQEAPQGIAVSTHHCDVSSEDEVLAFCEAVKAQHQTDQINLLFNNAGVAGGGSFINDTREDWDRTFNICWYGVYYCARAFMPLLVASSEGHIINTSSVNGFWASLGPMTSHTAYSSAKFAVKGFSEALLNDLRLNAPHVKVSVVMPGHIGTDIGINTGRVLGKPDPMEMTPEELTQVRQRFQRLGIALENMSDEEIQMAIKQQGENFRDNAPVSSAEAAAIILDGVRNEKWRILVGEDAALLDQLVRESPETAYEPSFTERMQAEGQWDTINAGEPE